MVKNIGNDSYSTNLKGKTTINNKNFNNYAPKKHPKVINEDKFLLEVIKSKLKPNFLEKVFTKILKC